jgi:hypothetical protein
MTSALGSALGRTSSFPDTTFATLSRRRATELGDGAGEAEGEGATDGLGDGAVDGELGPGVGGATDGEPVGPAELWALVQPTSRTTTRTSSPRISIPLLDVAPAK